MIKNIDNTAMTYTAKQKENFNGDGWWNATPKDLVDDVTKEKRWFWYQEHDDNPDYWSILFGDVTKEPNLWKDKVVLDFGFGFGGNIKNLFKIAEWKKIYGAEIADRFVDFGKEFLKLSGFDENRFDLFETNGYDLSYIDDNCVDLITSIVVLQHIALYQVRYNIFKEFYRVMKNDGILSFQMNRGTGINYYSTEFTHGRPNCNVENENQLIDDLVEIGFKRENISFIWKSKILTGLLRTDKSQNVAPFFNLKFVLGEYDSINAPKSSKM